VSFLSEKKFRLQNKMEEIKDKSKRVIGEVKGDIIGKWEEKSNEFIKTFLLLFGRDRLSNIWNGSKDKIMSALSPPGSPSGSLHEGDEQFDDEDYFDEPEMPGATPPPQKRVNRNVSPQLRNYIVESDSNDDVERSEQEI
jgi:choline-phosphate cytidylyltransferase